MNNNYEWLNYIPEGWENIARQMIQECEAINPTYTIEDMKEKWGALRTYSYCQNWYDNDSMETNLDESKAINNIERKYELISERICSVCGAPATKISTGWICPYCDNCGDKEEKYYKKIE